MTRRTPVNMAASVCDRLKLRAASASENYNLLLVRYAAERLLYRLSRSAHADSFTLKGATLFAVWEDEPHRPTRDVDLLGTGEGSDKRLRGVFTDVCGEPVADDGMVFAAESIKVRDIREGRAFGGKRVLIDGRLGNVRLRVQVDVGFGDALALPCEVTAIPALLDLPAPRLRVCPVETVIAEKLHALAEHGVLTSRMKDIFDLVALPERLEFDGVRLCDAVRATFESRGRSVGEMPAPLTEAFASDGAAVERWNAFMGRDNLGSLELATAVERARAFLVEPLAALRDGEAFAKRWSPGGPWQ